MALILGYVYFVIYALFILLVSRETINRFLKKRSRQNESKKLLKSLSRVKFSEGLFGTLSEDSECVICMVNFSESDLITRLECGGNHVYHTSCIESWIG
jgi:hypothetical protein